MAPKIRHLVNDSAQSSDNSVYKLSLPNQGALHALLVKVRCTTGATEAHTLTIMDALDDVQIIGDGSEVLFSLIPEEIEKWQETLFGRPLHMIVDEGAGVVMEGTFPILFGRELYDPNFYLPLSKFNDVELQLAFSPTISATAGFATGTFSVDIVAVITPGGGGVSYQGTLCTRRIKNFTSLASGIDSSELHANTRYRAIGVYAYESGIADGVDITKVELEDTANGESLFVGDWDNFLQFNRELFGCQIEHTAKLFGQDNDTWNCRIANVRAYDVVHTTTLDFSGDIAYLAMVDAIAGDLLTLAVGTATIVAGSEVLATYATDAAIYASAKGDSPSYFGLIPFMYDDSPGGYLNSGDYGKLEVHLTQGAAGADVRVSVQEHRMY